MSRPGRAVHHIEVSGLRIGYERAGAGPPVVLVPGFVGGVEGTWGRQLAGLSDEFEVVAWDPPGSGWSADPPEAFRLPDYANVLAQFVEALGLHYPHLVGLSFGGAVIVELWRRHSRLPATIVLAGAYAGWRGSLGPEAADQRLEASLRAAALTPDQFAAAMVPSMFSPSPPPEALADFSSAVARVRPAGFRTMATALAEADVRDLLPQIDVPTLVVHGADDSRATLDVASALVAAIPTARLVVLPGVGHVSPVEAPEAFNREVRDFLRSSSDAAP